MSANASGDLQRIHVAKLPPYTIAGGPRHPLFSYALISS